MVFLFYTVSIICLFYHKENKNGNVEQISQKQLIIKDIKQAQLKQEHTSNDQYGKNLQLM